MINHHDCYIYIIIELWAVLGFFPRIFLDFCGLAWYLLTLIMGLDPNKTIIGIWLTFAGIQSGPYSLPAPPNGTWFLPLYGPMAFGLTTDKWSMHYHILNYAPYSGYASFGSKLLVPDTWVFDALIAPGGSADLYRAENFITDSNEGYYSGSALVLPVYGTTMPKDIQTVLSDVRMDGPDQVFAEQFTAICGKRAVRLARKADHSCCYFALAPVLNVL